MADQYKRRLIPIVDRSFQFKYTGVILAVAATVSTILAIFLWRSYSEMNEMLEVAGFSKEISSALDQSDAKFVFSLTMAFLVGEVVVLGALGLIITHRVVGPIFVIQRHLQTLIGGTFPTLRPLRNGDEFGAVFSTFRQLVETLKKRDEDELAHLRRIVTSAREKGLAEEDVAALQQLVDARVARIQGAPRAS